VDDQGLIQSGSVVRLKSGGPKMTVVKVYPGGGVIVRFFAKGGLLSEEVGLPTDAVRRVPDAEKVVVDGAAGLRVSSCIYDKLPAGLPEILAAQQKEAAELHEQIVASWEKGGLFGDGMPPIKKLADLPVPAARAAWVDAIDRELAVRADTTKPMTAEDMAAALDKVSKPCEVENEPLKNPSSSPRGGWF
jgi:uncharacterized protein YodC (DUF2158 family)